MGSSRANRKSAAGRVNAHRIRHRRRSHREADARDVGPLKTPDHPLVSGDEAELITDQASLDALLTHVREHRLCAYDTEFIGETTYFPILCLIQLGTSERVGVIDAMAEGVDLDGVWELLADAEVRKIVHAGGQDLEPVQRHIGRPAANVFDTQIAAGFVGLPYPLSLQRLVEQILNWRLGKGLTFTSWDERPLSKAHLRYAADDVRYLPAVYAGLIERLGEGDIKRFVEQECEGLCRQAASPPDILQIAMRVKGAKRLPARRRNIVCELAALRDEIAREENVPPRSLMPDACMGELARRKWKSVEALHDIRGLPRPIVEAFGRRMLDRIEAARDLPADHWPSVGGADESPAQQFAIDGLWSAAQAWCLGHGVDPSVVTSRQGVADYYFALVNGDDLDQTRLGAGWRRQWVGRLIEELIAGDRRLDVGWRDDRLQAEARYD